MYQPHWPERDPDIHVVQGAQMRGIKWSQLLILLTALKPQSVQRHVNNNTKYQQKKYDRI